MKPIITLHLNDALEENPRSQDLSRFSTILRFGNKRYFSTREGRVLVQSFGHRLVYIDLIEFSMIQSSRFNFRVKEPGLFMFVMLKGHSWFAEDHLNDISENLINSCYLCYLHKGEYNRTLLAGSHKVLLLTFNPDWLMLQSEEREEMQQLLTHYLKPGSKSLILPVCGVAQKIHASLNKFNKNTGLVDPEITIPIFINECIRIYYPKLAAKSITNAYQQHKTTLITDFVKQHFADAIMDDLPALANRFLLSEKSLQRFARLAFGKPLHQQVIVYRMLYGLKQLMLTHKSISEIAIEMGYRDVHYFSRAFKKHFGLTPNLIQRPDGYEQIKRISQQINYKNEIK